MIYFQCLDFVEIVDSLLDNYTQHTTTLFRNKINEKIVENKIRVIGKANEQREEKK